MGRDKRREKGRLPPFVPLFNDTLDTPAWRTMSHGAQVLYVALKRRYSHNSHNNGRVFLSQRDAAKELNSNHTQIARWYRELVHYGFIVQQTGGCLGADGLGKAPHWRLTEIGYMRDPPTRDFTKWDGRPFKNKVKPRQRPQKRPPLAIVVPYGNPEARAGKQAHPVLENRHTTMLENRHGSPADRAGNQHIRNRGDRAGNQAHN
jgi:hypothetical protein